MDANRQHDDEDADDEEERDAPTSVTHVPEALLRSLKNPERSAPTVRPPPPAPVVVPPPKGVVAPPPSPVATEDDPEEDRDDSETLVASSKRALLTHAARPAKAAPVSAPIEPKPTSGTERRIERFHEETEDSPDEDPSDTGLATEIPEQVMRHLSQRPPTFDSIKDIPIPPPPGAPMFEPPTAEMFNPPPPEHRTDPPPPPIVARPPHRSPELATTLPSARLKKKKNVWVFVAVAAAFVLVASLGFTAYSVFVR